MIIFFKNIFWFFYKKTKRGKRDYLFRSALEGFDQRKKESSILKLNIMKSASKKMKPKKIIAFIKGSSVSKSRVSNHGVIHSVKSEHKQLLKENSLKINKSGKFKSA